MPVRHAIHMRTFDDNQGTRWQAALLEASYGNIVLIFSPLEGSEVRQLLLGAANMAEAAAQLAEQDDAGLQAMLAKAAPWDPGAPGF